MVKARHARSLGDHRRPDRPASRRAGPARSRPHHPHQRRAAAVQFPAVAGRLQRAGVRADLLARFRPRRAGERDCRISPPRTAVRRADRADRLLAVAGVQPANEKPSGLLAWPAAAISCCASCRRWCWRRSRSPRPISADGVSSRSGPSPRSPCCGNGTRWSARMTATPCWRPARWRWSARPCCWRSDRPGIAIALIALGCFGVAALASQGARACGARPALSMRQRS